MKNRCIFIHDIGKEGCFVLTLIRGDALRIPVKVHQSQITVGQELCRDVPFKRNDDCMPTTITVPLTGRLLQSRELNTVCRWFGDASAKYVHIVFGIRLAHEEDPSNVLPFRDEILTRVQYVKIRHIRWLLRELTRIR